MDKLHMPVQKYWENKTVIRWKNVNKLNSKDMKLLKYKHQALHIRKENTDKYWTIFRE